MRHSLKDIELVDNYLNGKLNAEESAEFAKNLENNIELQELVNTQKNLKQAVQRKALKTEINNIAKGNAGWHKFSNWLLGGVILIIAGSLFLFFSQDSSIKQSESPIVKSVIDSISEPAKEDEISFNGLSTFVKPYVQTFQVNGAKGATIEGKEGTLVIIPTNAFLDENNKIVTEAVQFEMVEALKLEDMVLYNLGTTADGKALETGGMLHFNFTCPGKNIKVNPKRPLYVEVPTKEVKKGMMAFEGEVTNKKLNWKNPKPLKKYLANVDFDLLDFLPTGFEDTVKTLLPYKGHTVSSKQFVDSLYYTLLLSKEFYKAAPTADTVIKSYVTSDGIKRINIPSAPMAATTSVVNKERISELLCSGIDPISIKTIKTEPYSQSFIATKEFAERVIELHKLEKGNDLLQLYINNLNENLSHVDSMVLAKMGTNRKKIFEAFAAQGLTNIKDAQIYQEKLSAYYNKKFKEDKKAVENLQRELNKKNDTELNQLVVNYRNYIRISQARKDSINPPVLASQLPSRNVATSPSYSFQWAAYGWVNIDCYLGLLTNGSEEVNMTVNNAEGITEVYQWLNTINNLTPLIQEGQTVKALFPKRTSTFANAMKNTFCFAISRKDGQYKWFDLRYNPYETQNINIVLQPSTLSDIRKKLRTYNVNNDLEARLNKVEEQIVLMEKLRIIQLEQMEKYKEHLKLMAIKSEQIKKENQIIARLRSVAFLCESKPIESGQQWFR